MTPSTLRRRAPIVRFSRAKYGRELLIDAGMVSSWPDFDQGGRPHRLDFHDLLLITSGSAILAIDSETHRLSPGVVLVTRPGQVRQWCSGRIDGACVFFAPGFTSQIFSDPRFLDSFSFFRQSRPLAAFKLAQGGVREYLTRFRTMRREIQRLRDDAPHKLRAVLYDLFVQLDRAYRRQHGEPSTGDDALIAKFRAAVEEGFRHQHLVAPYARGLKVTPGHLNARCRAVAGMTAGAMVRQRIVLEAERRLLYSDAAAGEIAVELGFADPSYFTRFLVRETGQSPTALRRNRRKVPAGN
jgi:AraC-like DNA-binding protein